MSAQVTLLGQLRVTVDEHHVEIRSPKERALLARLALEPGTTVSADALVESLWPDGDGPDDPARALRYHVWHLRGLLEPDRPERSEGTLLLTRPGGYSLAIEPRSVDAVRLEADWIAVRALGDDALRRRDTLAVLLDSWRPASFGDGSAIGPLAEASLRLDRLRSTVLADRIAADLELGRDADLVPELEQLVTTAPYDERLRGQLMVALYRVGRQAEALAVFTSTRTLLIEELGVEPGPELRDLEQRILRHDGSLVAHAPAVDSRAHHLDRRANLPTSVDSFVGRDAERADVRRLLAKHRLVTLTGAGGVGKTRLAIEVARDLGDDDVDDSDLDITAFPDGVWLAELAPVTDETLVAVAVAQVWGLPIVESDALDVVLTFLGPRRLLLVLDNCEHVNAAAGRLVAQVLRKAPGVHVLATSRESLGISGEVAVRVPSLDDAAATLFVDRGRASRPSWSPSDADTLAIARICDRVDGIPLGLELAAGRLRSMSPAEIADHLDQSVGLLALASKNDVPRHRTLAATVEWSYALLSEAEQRLFRRASVFTGGFDLAAVFTVCAEPGASPIDTSDLVDSLVDKSLVVATPGVDGTRYRVLEPLRQWSEAQLVRHGELAEVRAAHARHYAELVADQSPAYHRRDQETALRRTTADYPNVRLALAWLADTGDVDRHLAMTFQLFSFWAHQNMHLEGLTTCWRSLDMATTDTDLTAQIKTAFVGAICGAWTRRGAAFDIARRCHETAERLDDPRSIGWAELALAVVHGNNGLPRSGPAAADDEAAVHTRNALRRWAANSGPAWWDPRWERGMQQLCSSIFLPPGPDRLAEFRAAEAAFQSVGDLGWLAILYAQALDHVDAAGPEVVERLLQEAAETAISPSWAAAAVNRLGILAQLRGDHEQAISYLNSAIEQTARMGDSDWNGESRFLALSHGALGDLNEASRLLEQTFDAIAMEPDEREVKRTLTVSGRVLEAAGEPGLAARAIGRAEPWQDDYVDTIGTVRARLIDQLGTTTTEALVAEGAAADLDDVVREVRAALRAIS